MTENFDLPTTVEDLHRFVSNNVQESIHLDYKDSRALLSKDLSRELPKDVSAFANSDGGVLIFGIREEASFPIAVDQGADNSVVSRERIEQIITSNVAPRIDGLIIRQIPLSDTHSAYAIAVPKSYRGPHQDRHTHKYYKRYNFKSAPMEDYEIADLRSRGQALRPLVEVGVEIRHGTLFLLEIRNNGDFPARNVRFHFSPEPSWESDPPAIIRNGIEVFPPKGVFHIFYGASHDILGADSDGVAEFEVRVTYDHPVLNNTASEVYPINLRDYLGTWGAASPIDELRTTLEKSLRGIHDELKEVQRSVRKLTSIAGPTGIRVSAQTLREVLGAFGYTPASEKRHPKYQSEMFFEEVLGVDRDLAYRLSRYFRLGSRGALDEIEGMTPDVLEKIRSAFYLEPEPRPE